MEIDQSPASLQVALETLAVASAPSQVPYRHATLAGKHGHGESGAGKSFGQTVAASSDGGGFPPKRQIPRVHCAIDAPHAANEQVVPSGSTQSAPASGAASGHTPLASWPGGAPPSGVVAPLVGSSLHDVATATTIHGIMAINAARLRPSTESL